MVRAARIIANSIVFSCTVPLVDQQQIYFASTYVRSLLTTSGMADTTAAVKHTKTAEHPPTGSD